jgi:hypothetical protein
MRKDSLITGLVLTLVGHAVWVSVMVWLNSVLPNTGSVFLPGSICFLLIMLLGLSQWIYLIPLNFWLKKKVLPKTAHGLVIGGCITFAINLVIILLALIMFPAA